MGNTARMPRPLRRPVVGSEESLPTAVREVIRLAGAAAAGGEPDPTGQHLLLDVEVDGVRCVLLRVPVARPDRDPATLNPREQEIARMVARGYANKTIAAVLDISTWTVGTYIRRIFAKLGVGTRAAMVANLKPGIVPAAPVTPVHYMKSQ